MLKNVDESQLAAARATYEGEAFNAALPIPFDARLTAYPGQALALSVTDGESAERIQRELEPGFEKMKLRSVIRPQAGLEGGCSLYIYALHADMAHAQAHLMRLLKLKNPDLEVDEIIEDRPYLTEHDALRLLRRLKNEFEPNLIAAWLKREK